MKKQLKNQKLTLGWVASLRELLPKVNKLHSKSPDFGLKRLESTVTNLLSNKGRKYTIDRLKAYRLVLQQYALQQPVEPVPFCISDKDGFPREINFLKPKIGDVDSIRYSFSVMRIIESFRCEPEYSVSTIIEESRADASLLDEISNYIHTCPVVGFIPPLGESTIVMSNKAGPNGPATITAMEDLQALRQENPALLQAIKQMLSLTGTGLNPDHYNSHKQGSFQASKLVLLSDKACKTRVIAIADWWSNTALSAIHKGCMTALSRLPGDVTYRQSSIPRLVKGLGNHLFSSDMTAFTDRFPIELEASLLEAAYGPNVSRLWKQIVSERVFHHREGGVRYACGNPMGLLSSWPVSTLTHHAVKQWCASKLGIRHKYLILGDDTLDSDVRVHDLYVNTIQRLGVSLSPSKCTRSFDGNAEFAKRHFLKHTEVTGLPVHLLSEVLQKPEQLIELLRICRERGYEDCVLGPAFLSLISRHKSEKMLVDMLSLPEECLGMPPLWGLRPETWSQILSDLPAELLSDYLAEARNCVWWETTLRPNKPKEGKLIDEVGIEENHPLVYALSEKLMGRYLIESDDEYSIYNEWMSGNYRELAQVPTLDNYRIKNRGHFATRSKFLVLKKLLALANGDNNIRLYPRTPVTNFELFARSYEVKYVKVT